MWKTKKEDLASSGGLEYLLIPLPSTPAQALLQWEYHLAVKDMLDTPSRFATWNPKQWQNLQICN